MYDNFDRPQLLAEFDRVCRELHRTDITHDERVALSHQHTSLRWRLYPDEATVSSVIEDVGYFVGMSESANASGPVGRTSPPTADEIAAATKRAHRVRFEDQRLEELRALAGDHTRQQAEQALGYLELEEASEGLLDMALTAQERAAAELLRDELNYKRELAEVRAAVGRQDERLQRLADEHANTNAVELSEHDGPIYNVVDSHGAKLLCLDDSIFNA